MILVDANVVLYAFDASSSRHVAARVWLEERLAGREPVGFPLSALLAFIRIGTDPRVFERPLGSTEAIDAVSGWLSLPVASIVEPGRRHWSILTEICERGRARGALTTDAHLAALAVEYGASIATTDRGFARFDGVDVIDPTA